MLIATAASGQTPSAESWVGTQRLGDVIYFFFNSPARAERYDLTASSWLAAVNFPSVRGSATTAAVDEDGFYVAYDKACYRYDQNGGNERFLLNSDISVRAFHSDGDILFINRSQDLYARFTSLNKTNNLIVDTFENYIYALAGSSIAPSINKLFGRSLGVSPSDITFVKYDDNGTFLEGGDSPQHGDFQDAERTWTFQNGARVVDNSGTVYSTGNLHYSGSFGSRFDDIAFRGEDVPVILRGKTLTTYNAALLPAGSVTLAHTASRLFVHDPEVLAFRFDTASATLISVEKVSLEALGTPEPGQPVDPKGLPFEIDGLWAAQDGSVLLLSKRYQSVFRWNPDTQHYSGTIPLLASPDYAAYSHGNNRFYLAYSDGLVRYLDLAAEELAEVPFAQLPASPLGLAAVGDYLMTGDASGAWMTHRTFDPQGAEISGVDWNYYSREYVWSETNQKLYFFRDSMSPNDLLWEEINADGSTYPELAPGAIGFKEDSPYHGEFDALHPIRVEPNGARVVIGSGDVFDAHSLARLPSGLANSFTDGDWGASAFWTLRSIAGQVQLQEWNAANFAQGLTRQWLGKALRLMTLPGGRLLAISESHGGFPSYHLFDESGNLLAPPVLEKPQAPIADRLTQNSLTISWPDIAGEAAYEVERKSPPSDTWAVIATTVMNETTFADGSVTAGHSYTYRVTAVNGTLRSESSAESLIGLTAPPTPSAPSLSEKTEGWGSSVEIAWTDGPKEDSYLLARKIGPAGEWTPIGTFEANHTVYTDYSVAVGIRIFYRLAAVNAIGTSGWSEEASIRFPRAPEIPHPHTITATPTSVSLGSWNVSFAEEMEIEWRQETGGAWLPLTVLPAANLPFTHEGLTQETRYEYRLRARNEDGISGWSETLAVTTSAIPPPARPQIVNVLGGISGTLAISWSDVAFEDGYALERRQDADWAEIHRAAAEVTSFTDTGLVNGLKYSYRVRAFRGAIYSSYSSVIESVVQEWVLIAGDDFDEGPLPYWDDSKGGTTLSGQQGLRDGSAFWFGAAGDRWIATKPLNLSGGGRLGFFFRAGNQAVDGNTYWNDSEAGEGVVLERSANGSTWTEVLALDTTQAENKAWRELTLDLAPNSGATATRFRWRQISHSGVSQDTWALDDVRVFASAPPLPAGPGFLIASPSAVGESPAATLYWQEIPASAVYEVERSREGGAWEPVTGAAADSFLIDTETEPGQSYSYRVRAKNGGGSSAWSPTAFVTTFGFLQAWRFAYLGFPGPAAEEADYQDDATGIAPVLRYAFGVAPLASLNPLNPLRPEEGGSPLISFDEAHGCLKASFIRPQASANSDLECVAEFSSDGVQWSAAGGNDERNVTPAGGLREYVECLDPARGEKPATRFARVRVFPKAR